MAEKHCEFERIFIYLFYLFRFENITFIVLLSQCYGLLHVSLSRMLGLHLIHMIRLKKDINTFFFLAITYRICTPPYFSMNKKFEKISQISISLEN